MAATVLTRDQILVAAEDVLRRYGPAKATVVDVARILGVSHGSVYRHFPTKTALREAVTERWLTGSQHAVATAGARGDSADERLRAWLAALFEAQRVKAMNDPELFSTYQALVTQTSEVVVAYLRDLVDQVRAIVADGVDAGTFGVSSPELAARAVLSATARFHDPRHAAAWGDPRIDDEFEAVCDLLIRGLSH